MFRYLNSRLAIYLFLTIAGILAIEIVAVGVATDLLHSDLHVRNVQRESELLELTIQHPLTLSDFSLVNQIFGNIGVRSDIKSVRLISSQGMVMASSVPDEVGVQLNNDEQLCQNCHQSESGALPLFVRAPAGLDNIEMIITANGLDNTVVCYSCHQDGGDHLGVLIIENRVRHDHPWIGFFPTGLVLSGLIIVIALVLTTLLVFQKTVVSPMFTIINGSGLEKASQRTDVVGLIAQKLQNAETRLKAMDSDTTFQHRGFMALLTLFEDIDLFVSVESVLRKALKTVQTITGFSRVAMRVHDENQHCFRLIAQEGMTSEMVEELACIPEDRGFQGEVNKLKRPVFTSDLASDPHLGGQSPLREGIQSLVCVPFLVADQVVGTMELAVKRKHSWDEVELQWLELVGRSVGILIHHVRLTDRLKGVLVEEEHNRVAQEIHDGLAQLLGSLRLWAEDANLALEKGESAQVQIALKKIELTARDAYASLREEIIGLRNTIVPGEDLLPVLTEYLDRFQRQWGIETKLDVVRAPSVASRLSLTPASEIQLLRIIQEGLTNIRRHANAHRIRLRVDEGLEEIIVSIQDDGKGFDPENVTSEGFGLKIMSERAASVGGRITIYSKDGQGTTLEIILPR
jgi:signal transduction histidine kinase